MGDFYFPGFDEFDFDDEEQSLCEYFLRLQHIFEKAQDEFDYVFATKRELKTIKDAISGEYSAITKEALESRTIQPGANPGDPLRLEVTLVHTPGLSMAELREQSALLRAESAAGSLILMVDDAIQRLRHSVWDATSKTPFPSDFTLGTLHSGKGYVATGIWAAGNAYRHAKDWEGLVDEAGNVNTAHSNYKESRRTLEVLQRLVGLDKVHIGCVCVSTLEAMSMFRGEPYIGSFWDGSLTAVAQAFANEYCECEDAWDRVGEALDYLRAYSSMEVSHSMNPDLHHSSNEDDA